MEKKKKSSTEIKSAMPHIQGQQCPNLGELMLWIDCEIDFLVAACFRRNWLLWV